MTPAESSRQETGPGSDDALIAKVRRGDSEAFGVLVQRYQRLVFRIAGGFLRGPGEVEDVAQETFLRAYQAIHRFRPGLPFGPWISRIAVNCCYDNLRRRRSRPEVAWEDLDGREQDAVWRLADGQPADERTAARDLAERLLRQLTVRDRQVLMLVDALGYTPAEAARLTGSTGILLRVRLHRARRRMRDLAARLLAGHGRDGGHDGSVSRDPEKG